MSVVVQLFVQDKARAPSVQLVVWGMFEVQGMIAIVVGGFEVFVEIVACFVVPLIATQSQGDSSNPGYMYWKRDYSHSFGIGSPLLLAHVFFLPRHNWTNISAMVHCVAQCTNYWGLFQYNCGGLNKC